MQTDLSYGRANKRSQTERPSELDVNSLEGDTRDINSDPGAGVRQEDEVLVTAGVNILPFKLIIIREKFFEK